MEAEQNSSANDVGGESSVASSHWTETIGTSRHCVNCGSPGQGDFCANCGQRQLRKRLKFADLSKTVFSHLLNVDRGLFHTFLDMMRRPGSVARDYVSGKQRPYVNPLTYFFIGTAIQLIAFFFCKSYVASQLQKNLNEQFRQFPAETMEKLQKLFAGDPAVAISECYVASIQQAYTYAALFFFCIPFAILLLGLHRLAGEKFRLGETFVFALYCFAQMLIITGVINVLVLRISSTWQGILAMGTYVVFPLYAHTGFFRSRWTSRLMTFLSTFIASCIFFASIMLIFVATGILTMAMAASASP